MREFLLAGGQIITPDQELLADLYVHAGRLTVLEAKATPKGKVERIDVSDCFVTPGLIDLQVNGTAQCNLWEQPNQEQFEALCEELLQAGVTSFLPTLITADIDHIKKNRKFLEGLGAGSPLKNGSEAATAHGAKTKAAMIRMPGIHLEGPFISPERPGVHPKEFIKAPNVSQLKEVVSPAVKLVTLAPEYGEGEAAARFLLDKKIAVSLGHSNATFEQAESAFEWGIKLMTHTFNALPPLHHRAVGAVGAALLKEDVFCCVIADGLHLNQEMVKIIIRLKGADRVVLVTDVAHVGTSGGGLVGSSIMLSDAVRNIVAWGAASFRDAIKMATYNPARAINLENDLGSIKSDGLADLVVWEKGSLKIKHVVVGGQLVF
jgi:N-acetylglucosamine-6-phosphate deacetylase